MQRKNNILGSSKRNAMAMIMAIIVIVIVSTILALSLKLSSQTTQKTADLYLYEQAAILSHSAAEYAMVELTRVNPCSLANIPTFRYNDTFDISIVMRYVPVAGTTCYTEANNASAVLTVNGNQATVSNNTYSENGTVILDVTVTANPTGTTEPIRYFRRTLQKL